MYRLGAALFLGLLFVSPPSIAEPVTGDEALNAIVSERLDYYAYHFPDIEFVHLPGGEESFISILQLRQLLGQNATSLVYEHPAELASELLDVSLRRVQYMLNADLASSSFFAVGDHATATRPTLCVITLSPRSVAASDRGATENMMPIDVGLLPRTLPERLLDHRMHLEFVVDHEVFHCLDAHQNGPIAMSDKEHWGDYMAHINEHGADAFAVAMHIQRRGERTGYARNLMRVRALALLGEDSNHFTPESINQTLNLLEGSEILSEMTPNALVALADRVRTEVVGDYEAYLRFRWAAQQAVEQTADPFAFEGAGLETVALEQKDTRLADTLVTLTSSCYTAMFGTPLDTVPMPDTQCNAYMQ